MFLSSLLSEWAEFLAEVDVLLASQSGWGSRLGDRGGTIALGGVCGRGESLGRAGELRDRICSAVPAVDFSDPSWGVVDTDDFSIEIDIGSEPIVRSLMLHVRGGDARSKSYAR